MSKKKKKVQPKPVNKRLRAIVCVSVSLAILLGGVLTWYLVTKEPSMTEQYNGALTARARQQGYISVYDVLIVHTVDDSAEGYTELECYIYQVPDGVKIKRMLRFDANEVEEKWGIEPVGYGSAKCLKGDATSLYSLSVSYVK